MTALMERMHAWVVEAPWLAIMMLAGAFVIFWWVIRSRDVPAMIDKKAKWVNITVQALALPLIFLFLLWGVRVVLNRTELDFSRQHGRVSAANQASVESIWGKPHVQRDLTVYHTYQVPVQEEVRDQFDRVVTRTRMDERSWDQNSIVRTRGDVALTPDYRRKGSALYPGFTLDCAFDYTVKNFADRVTTAHFSFPLSPGQAITDGFTVLVNGKDMSSRLNFNYTEADWTLPMQPGQVADVSITYKSRGMQRFYYQVSDIREIRDFVLDLKLKNITKRDLNYPEGCITPTTITEDSSIDGSRVTWKLDRALTTRGMGIALPQPEQPGQHVARILHFAWRAGTLFLVAVAFTMIALNRRFNIVTIALLAGIYIAQYMLLAAVSDYSPFWLSWLVTTALGVGMSIVVLGGKQAPKVLIGLTVAYLAIYPLLTLPNESYPSLLAAMNVATLVYLGIIGMLMLKRDTETPDTQAG